MKILKTFSLLTMMLLLMVACEERPETTAEAEMATAEIPNPDEAMEGWREAWNANDAQRLKDYAADDAVLMVYGQRLTGEELNTWMDTTASWMQDLRTEALMTEKGENVAWEAGTYTHGTAQNDTLQMSGTYTLIWQRADDMDNGDWKIRVMDISPEQEPMPQPQQ